MVDVMLLCIASSTIASVAVDSDTIDRRHWACAQDSWCADRETSSEYSNQHRSRTDCMLSTLYGSLSKTNRKIVLYCRNHTLLCRLRQIIEVKMGEKGKSS